MPDPQQPSGRRSVVPRPRGKLSALTAVALCCALLLWAAVWRGSLLLLRYTAVGCLALSTGSILRGACLLVEELVNHSFSRYRGNLMKMLKACFHRGHFLCLAVVCVFNQLEPEDWLSVCMACICSLLFSAMGLCDPAAVEVSEIVEQRKMNVGHGLAWSFYTGYLRLILPTGLEASIEEYHASRSAAVLQHRDTWKLHILIPLSCCIPDKLEEADDNISFLDNLPDITIDRAGIRKRVFKHSIYTIYDQAKRPHYCVVEYATPLVTLYQMSQEAMAGFDAEERLQQSTLFFRTLRDILESSRECRGRYRLILLDDCRALGEGSETEPHFLSQEILRHLEQQKREEYCIREAPNTQPQDALSRQPTLMISNDLPQPLRSIRS
ncbi:stimulator of interferon genes protein isoform X1 [Lepisosteus oculatus]|uniref:stimulator of interferon genes protein isoform X1 n=1 Tax=Lepisosteus oculatus TaxID=7918 RepID=UPI0035F526CD